MQIKQVLRRYFFWHITIIVIASVLLPLKGVDSAEGPPYHRYEIPVMSNWYTRFKLAMPLPPAENYPKPGPFGHRGGMSDLDHRTNEEDAKQIANRHPNLRYLGHGIDGVAYTHQNPNTVIKITNSVVEARFAEQLLGKNVSCCARVFDVHDNENDTWTIEVEKVRVLTPEQQRVISLLHQNKPLPSDPTAMQLASQWKKLKICLHRNGFPTNDIHFNNIGFRDDGTLVLFDFGPNESL